MVLSLFFTSTLILLSFTNCNHCLPLIVVPSLNVKIILLLTGVNLSDSKALFLRMLSAYFTNCTSLRPGNFLKPVLAVISFTNFSFTVFILGSSCTFCFISVKKSASLGLFGNPVFDNLFTI